jgi:hypothetical protein
MRAVIVLLLRVRSVSFGRNVRRVLESFAHTRPSEERQRGQEKR